MAHTIRGKFEAGGGDAGGGAGDPADAAAHPPAAIPPRRGIPPPPSPAAGGALPLGRTRVGRGGVVWLAAGAMAQQKKRQKNRGRGDVAVVWRSALTMRHRHRGALATGYEGGKRDVWDTEGGGRLPPP